MSARRREPVLDQVMSVLPDGLAAAQLDEGGIAAA
jgi:hypothetical protein